MIQRLRVRIPPALHGVCVLEQGFFIVIVKEMQVLSAVFCANFMTDFQNWQEQPKLPVCIQVQSSLELLHIFSYLPHLENNHSPFVNKSDLRVFKRYVQN